MSPRALLGCAVLLALALALPGSAAATPVPLAQLGSDGSGAGQLHFPDGVAIDDGGNVYVADTGNHRISEFAANGTFIRAFGGNVNPTGGDGNFETCTTATTCQAGNISSDAGEFWAPVSLALDGGGHLYVSDVNYQRISVFNIAGPVFVHAFGWGVDDGTPEFQVCSTTSTCQLGLQGGGAGQLKLPFGLAVDGTNLYVADQSNNRISVFNTTGPTFTSAFGWGVDDGTSEYQVCASTCQSGSGGGGAGQLNVPVGLALDGTGHLYVGENGNPRISVFNTAGPSFAHAFGWEVQNSASGVFEVCASPCLAGTSGDGGGQLSGPGGVAINSAGSLYVSDFGNDRISAFNTAGPSFTHSFGWDVAGGSGVFEVCPTDGACTSGASGAGVGQLNEPEGLAADCRGAVWVADEGNSRVQRFGEPGTPLAPCPPPPPDGGGGAAPPPVLSNPSGPTGQRARAKKRCKKKPKGPKRVKCLKKAKKLPV
jgi:tripartite motif-containing protein 71